MRPLLSLKTLLRSPVSTILTFLLLAAASFALFSRVTDYAVTSREAARAASYYRGVAALDTGVPNTSGRLTSVLNPDFARALGDGLTTDIFDTSGPMGDQYSRMWNADTAHETAPPPALTGEQIKEVTSLPQVTSADARVMTAGVSDKYTRVNLDLDGGYIEPYTYNTRYVIEGTLSKIDELYQGTPYWGYSLTFTDPNLLAGYPGMIGRGSTLFQMGLRSMDGGNYFGCESYSYDYCYWMMLDNPFGERFADTLKVGSRYLMVARWDPYMGNPSGGLFSSMLGDLDTMDYCPSFYSLDGEPDDYLDTPEFAKVKELIDITNQDVFTFDMVYTSDMMSIPRFNENKMVITDGRALNADDTGADSCVVSNVFLVNNHLKIGDTISMGLCGKLLPQHSGIGAVAVTPDRYSPPVKTAELTIVGAYMDTDTQWDRNASQYWSYSPNTIFVPSSLLPVEIPADHEYYPGEYSFIVGDAYKIGSFLSAITPLEDIRGFKLRFDDGGWSQVSENMKASSQISLLTTVLFLFAAAVAALLAVLLFIGRNRKNYAIMRALGATRGVSGRTLALPLGVIAILAMPIGGGVGLYVASRSINSALAAFAAGVARKGSLDFSQVTMNYVPDYSLPITAIIVCAVCAAALLCLIAAIALRALGGTRPLALLQGAAPKAAHDTKTDRAAAAQALDMGAGGGTLTLRAAAAASTPLPSATAASTPLPLASAVRIGKRYGAPSHVAAYIARHMRRTKWKTALSVLLALVMTGAVGLFAIAKLSYENLYAGIEVKGYFVNMCESAAVEASSSPLVKDAFYRGTIKGYYHDTDTTFDLALTNNIDRYAGETVTVQYAAGYDSSLFSQDVPECVIGGQLAQTLGVSLGDEIKLIGADKFMMDKFNLKKLGFVDENGQPDEDKYIAAKGVAYTVAGIASTPDGTAGMTMFAPAGHSMAQLYGNDIVLEQAEFTLADNSKADELRALMAPLLSTSLIYSPLASFVMDTSELDNVTRIRDLLQVLFPIAVAASVLIGLIAPVLIIMQSSKEAAILRVLGTTKRRVRSMLALEQAVLCVVGIALAVAGLSLYNAWMLGRVAGTLCVCYGIYLAGCVAAVAVAAAAITRRRVLDLLQEKE